MTMTNYFTTVFSYRVNYSFNLETTLLFFFFGLVVSTHGTKITNFLLVVIRFFLSFSLFLFVSTVSFSNCDPDPFDPRTTIKTHFFYFGFSFLSSICVCVCFGFS